MWSVDRLGPPNHNVLSLEQQMPQQQDTDRRSKSIEESEECDDTLSELAGIACHPDSTINADTWVKAAEFVPGQLWQSLGK